MSVRQRNPAMVCWEHYRHVVRLVDEGRHDSGLSPIDRADIYLEQVLADNPQQHDTVMEMLSSHYGISWEAMR